MIGKLVDTYTYIMFNTWIIQGSILKSENQDFYYKVIR